MSDTKLTPEITEIICQYIEKGNSIETAAQAVGICRKTFYNWLDRGEKEEPEFIQFTHNIKKARAKSEMRHVEVIEDAMDKSWQAAAWWLERRNRDKWGQHTEQKIEHTGKIDSNITYEYKVIENAVTSPSPVTPKTTGSNGSDETI
jgi:transposase